MKAAVIKTVGTEHTADIVQKQARVTTPTVFSFVFLQEQSKKIRLSTYEKLNLDIGIDVLLPQNNCKEATNLGIK